MKTDAFRKSIEDVITENSAKLKSDLDKIVMPKLETILRKISKSFSTKSPLNNDLDYMDLFRKLGLSHLLLHYYRQEYGYEQISISQSYVNCFLKGMEIKKQWRK